MRANASPLRPLLALAHRAAMLAAARLLAAGGGSAYVRGGFSQERPLFGVSDIDLNAVLATDATRPGDNRTRVRERWRRLTRWLPPLGRLLHVFVYEQDALNEAVREPSPMYGVDDEPAPGRSAYFGTVARGGAIGLLEGGLYGPLHGWRRVAGPARLPAPPPPAGPELRRMRAWLALQSWWRFAFAACLDPAAPWVPLMCVKLVSEPARAWIWATEGVLLGTRAEVLARARALLPEEEDSLRAALELERRLPESPDPPLAEALGCCARTSARVAALIDLKAQRESPAEVVLLGAPPAGTEPLPLCDWRARTLQDPPDESFVLAAGSVGDPDAVAAAARGGGDGAYVALGGDGFLLLPASDWDGGRMRAIQCAATDPVSFALLAGRTTASFPQARGWSARDCARRAAAEQAPRLRPTIDDDAPEAARLWSAARAALFLDSLAQGSPALPLTVEATAEALGERVPAVGAPALENAAAYRDWRRDGAGGPPAPAAELTRAVRTLLEPNP